MDNVEELVKTALQDAKVGVTYTVHGERPTKYVEGKYVMEDYPEEKLGRLHRRFKPEHHEVMEVIYSAIIDIVKLRRSIPLTRNELLRPASRRGVTQDGIAKKLVNDLIKFGLIQERIIKIVNKVAKPVRAQAVIYFTPRGRDYVRTKIDEGYSTN